MQSFPAIFFFLFLVASPVLNAQRYQVVITEIMADPTPQVGLPNAEYIELTNLSGATVDLFGWKISDATTTATINVHYLLAADSMVILCSNANVSSLTPFGKTIGVSSFPSLDNDGDQLTLRSPALLTVHAIAYKPDWYDVTTKKEGGWSLEMIDLKSACTGKANWEASISSKGGTPGKLNSVNGSNPDIKPPALVRSYSLDSISVTLVFDKTLDSISASSSTQYHSDRSAVVKAYAIPPLFNTVKLQLASPMNEREITTITATGIKDCSGNTIGGANLVKAGKPSFPQRGDIVINEILFNPRSAAYDYVEIVNNSNKVIDLSQLYIANRDVNRLIASLERISADPFYLFPGEYIVLTEDALNLAFNYLVKDPGDILDCSMPSLPDDEGTALLVHAQGDIIDEVNYKDNWHFALIADAEGVSLERIDPGDSSNYNGNWHSAAATAGYGTPGYQNSQYKRTEPVDAEFTVDPPLFSPDNDGTDDVAVIHYQLESRGFVGNIMIFDTRGVIVKHLVKNELLGLSGKWKWDGSDENKQKLQVGTYIILVEIFNLQGKRKVWKKTVVLARRM